MKADGLIDGRDESWWIGEKKTEEMEKRRSWSVRGEFGGVSDWGRGDWVGWVVPPVKMKGGGILIRSEGARWLAEGRRLLFCTEYSTVQYNGAQYSAYV
jgi:hypothetical protein